MKCYMPGARPAVKPLSAGESSGSSASDEVSQLELQSQRQLEEDIARIFDESIYCDLEVVCGKLKILTHSCILKARTHKFYHKLETILHVNIGRNTFDEIYSFISDAYTECNILYEEKEIIKYLDEKLGIEKTNVTNSPTNKPEEKDDPEVYSTPNCVSPEENNFHQTQNSSPSTELTKEYYALVPIDGDVLDRELIEQDALSNAFHSIHKSQVKDVNATQNTQCVKPTSLCLDSSHTPEIHSNSCDILKKPDTNSKGIVFDEKKSNNDTSQTRKTIEQSEADSRSTVYDNISNLPETSTDKLLDPTYTPDSLIADEPSSSSDYLSAAYAVSPGIVFSSGFSQLNVGENATKMNNIVTISDSGLETSGMLDSLNSCKDVTLTDVSLTESTVHDMINEDNNCQDSASNTLDKSHVQIIRRSTSLNSPFTGTSTAKDLTERKYNKSSLAEINCSSTKDEKQRLNEEIVILESSSLSSETGSWESVFPPNLPVKDMCERFIASERKSALEEETKIMQSTSNVQHETHNGLCPSLVRKSPYKSTSCFIDAASLSDEADNTHTHKTKNTNPRDAFKPSTPVPCKRAYGPNDWSDSNETEDSPEQPENIKLDGSNNVSQTIFEMTPTNEDDKCWNAAGYAPGEQNDIKTSNDPVLAGNRLVKISKVRVATSTPNNSILSVKNIDMNRIDESDNENDLSGGRHDINSLNPHLGHDEYVSNVPSTSIINITSSSSLIFVDNNSSQLGSQSNDWSTKTEIENIPIVSGAYIPEPEEIPERPPRTTSNSSFWVVDMSSTPKSDISECSVNLNNPVDKSIEEMRSAPKPTNSGESYKSRNSVDSDSSEKSTHNFYIDLSSLPDAVTPEQRRDKDEGNEKKNIFSMFIDLGDKSTTAKEMPARLSSSLNTKKSTKIESKISSTGSKPPKASDSNVVARCVASTSRVTDENIMFEKLESLCADPSISISEIKNIPFKVECPIDAREIPNTKQTTTKGNDLFVKLSDLDKPAPKAKPVTTTEKTESRERMSRSIPDSDWRESTLSINLRSNEIISSFHSENALSLNRLFPHLKNDFSRSMPGSLSSKSKSPSRPGASCSAGDVDERQTSDAWKSSVDKSTTVDMDQATSLSTKCQSRLGEDLLRMFLEEIGTDVVVEASGQRIKAHKCILASRCQYFAGILSGDWVESSGNVITMPPFTFGVIHFALCHIYSGVSVVPNTVSIVELATLADMLGLEGLKEGIMFILKENYCHHFHKPCALCTAGVLECLPLASVHGLDDLYRNCLRWIAKHFQRVWTTKAFAALPTELIEKCYQEHVINLCTDNFVETVYGCGNIVSSLESCRWSDVVVRICRRLVDSAAQFAAVHLCDVLNMLSTEPADAPPAAVHALHDCLSGAIEWAPSEQTCRAYHLLTSLVDMVHGQAAEGGLGSALLSVYAPTWRLLCEGALVRNGRNVVTTAAFLELPARLRDRLRDIVCILYGVEAPVPAPILWLPRPLRHVPPSRRNVDLARGRSCFVPYALEPQSLVGSSDSLFGSSDSLVGSSGSLPEWLGRVQYVTSLPPAATRPRENMNKTFPFVRTTRAQVERAKFNFMKTQSAEAVMARPARGTNVHILPRHLRPRQSKNLPAHKSTDSSRYSSPVQRGARASTSRPAPRPRTADLSADSLNESYNNDKYATYTRAKHNLEGSVDAVNTSANSRATVSSNDMTVTEMVNAKNKITTTKTKTQRSVPAAAPLNLENQPVVPLANVKRQPAITPCCKSQAKTTKIPVYKHVKQVGKERKVPQRQLDQSLNKLSLSPVPNKSNERIISGSLMSATKSSEAKMVSKTVKETTNSKCSSKQDTNVESKTKNSTNVASCSYKAPVMERSGTFLKDEPFFSDQSTDIDEKE